MSLADHLDKLKAFKIAAESKTFHEAARKLNMTQPALTRLVQTLERAVDAKLFVRSRSGVIPTAKGEVLLSFSIATLIELEDVTEKLKFPTETLSGHFRIGSYESLAEYLWPNFLPFFRKQYPHFKISLRTTQGADFRKALERGEMDMLVDAEPDISDSFTSWPLYRDRFNLFYKKSEDVKLTQEHANLFPLVYCPSAFDENGKSIIDHLESSGYFFKERIELDSFPSVLAFCRSGAGISVLPQRLAAEGLKVNQIVPAVLKGIPSKGFGSHTIAATIHDRRADDPRVGVLISSLKAWLKTKSL